MPTFNWVEDNQSRSASIVRLGKKAQSTYVKSWKIFGSADDVAIHADVNATLSAGLRYWQYPGQPLNKLQADHYELEYLGDNAWQLKVTYIKEGAEDDQQEDPLRRARSFDTSGGTQHITQAAGGKVTVLRRGTATTTVTEGTERRYPPTATSMNEAIGVDGDSVAGVDIIVPALTWTETHDVPSSFVDGNYIKALSALTGTVNNATFRNFAPGEVLFAGASGSQEWDEQKGDGPWTLTYKFIASANVEDIKVGAIDGIDKKGHEYLWVRYEAAVDGNDLIKRPKAVYVNKVYKDGDFSILGI